MYIYVYIYIIYGNQKKTKEIYVPFLSGSNSKDKKYTKLKISNGIQYKPQKRTFEAVNKSFSC